MAVAKQKTPDLLVFSKEEIDRARSTFTFPDSGITVRMERLGAATAQTIRKAILKEKPSPPIPVQEVDYGDGDVRHEENPADPDYETAKAVHEETVAIELANRMLALAKRRMEVEVDTEAVQRLRDDMEAIEAPIEEDDDRTVYIEHFCLSTEKDMIAITAFLMRISQPTEEAVQEHVDSFRGNV